MIKRAATFAWGVRHQFVKYFIVGFSGLFLDMGILIALREWIGWSAVFAVVVSQIVVLSYNFTLNKYWSFKNKSLPHRQFVRYAIVVGVNYVIGVAAMFVFHTKLGFDYRVVRLGTIAAMVSANFLLYKFWVYT